MLLLRNIIITFFGVFLFLLTFLYPLFKMVYFDWIAIIIMMIPWILDVWDMYKQGTLLQTDSTPKWKMVTDYIDRNRDVHTLLTHKPYHTQSFLEGKGFGLIENKGKDSVLKKGTKKYVLALENCEHTPDPDMLSASDILYNDMGIRDTNTLKKLLSGEYIHAAELKIMGLSMVAMMTYHNRHGGAKLVQEWKEYEGPNQSFKPKEKPQSKIRFDIDKIHDTVDDIIKNRVIRRGGKQV